MPLNREAIFASKSRLKIEPVNVPEWADESGDDLVYVRELTGEERDAYESSMTRQERVPGPRGSAIEIVPDMTNHRAKLIVRAVCDEQGERLFTDGDLSAVGALSSGAIDRLYAVAARLSGMTNDAESDAVGNSEAAQNGGSI